MGPAPIPPHERSWRHPSEIGPTVADAPAAGGGRRIVLVSGALTVALAVVVIVTFSPRPTSSPDAISATTIAITVPPAQIQPRASAKGDAVPGTVLLQQQTMTRDRSRVLTGAPAAIAANHVDDLESLELAAGRPSADDSVIVVTVSHAYDVAWRDVERMAAPDGTLVVTPAGMLVATFVSGELRLLVD